MKKKKIFTSYTIYRVVTSFICFFFSLSIPIVLCSVLCHGGLEAWKLHFPSTPTILLAGFLFLQWEVVERYKLKGHKIYFLCFSLVGCALGSGGNNSGGTSSSTGVWTPRFCSDFFVEVVETGGASDAPRTQPL